MAFIRTNALALLFSLVLIMCSRLAIGTAGASVPAVIAGFHISADTLTFTVVSTGCTHQDDFILEHRSKDDRLSSVTLLRTRVDHCRRMPFEVDVSFQRPTAIGPGHAVTITNSFYALNKRRADDTKLYSISPCGR